MSDGYRLIRQELSPEIGILQVDSDTGNTPVIVVNTREPVGLARQAIRAFRHTHALAAPLVVITEGLRRLWLEVSTATAVSAAALCNLAIPVEAVTIPHVDLAVVQVRDRPPLNSVNEPEGPFGAP